MRKRKNETGVILFIVLIMLVVMAIGSAALIRSVETTNQVSGNLAFKIASVSAADLGIEAAIADIGTVAASSADTQYPSGCTPAAAAPNGCKYYPLALATDSNGIPTIVNWTSLGPITSVPGYEVRYVIDRMCSGSLPVTNIAANCKTLAPSNGGTKKAGGVVFTRAAQIYYRVTVRVDGPRSTRSYVRAVFSR
jgi:Tfp pilus assembly protein PilX